MTAGRRSSMIVGRLRARSWCSVTSPSGDGRMKRCARRKRISPAWRDCQAMGELSISIAHEVNQPLMAIGTDAETCLLYLGNAKPNLEEARRAAERVIRGCRRAANVVASVTAFAKRSPPEMTQFDINEAITEVLDLMRAEIRRHEIQLLTEFTVKPTLRHRGSYGTAASRHESDGQRHRSHDRGRSGGTEIECRVPKSGPRRGYRRGGRYRGRARSRDRRSNFRAALFHQAGRYRHGFVDLSDDY